MSNDRRRAAFGRPNKFAFAPIKFMSPPPRISEPYVTPHSVPKPNFESSREPKDHSELVTSLALATFGFIGATTAIAGPAEAAVVQMVDQEMPDSLLDIDLRVETIDSVAEEIDEADIAPALESAVRKEVAITFNVSIETDGTAHEIDAVRKVLDAIEGINSKTEEKTVWAEYTDKALKGLEIAADIAEGLAGIGSIAMMTTAGVKFFIGGSDGDRKNQQMNNVAPMNDVIAVQVQTTKDRPKGPLAKGVKTADEMAKAMRKLAKPLARAARKSG